MVLGHPARQAINLQGVGTHVSWDGPLEKAGAAKHDIPASYRGKDGNITMNVPGRIIAAGELLEHIQDDLAPEQVANVATLPGIVGHALAMPDIHWGYGFPIGGVAAFDPNQGGVVSPGGVGFDINCGVRLLRTNLSEAQVRPRLRETIDELFASVPCGMGKRGHVRVDDAALDDIMVRGANWAKENGWATEQDVACIEENGCIEGADPSQVSDRARLRGSRTLGSLGSGNHFLEVQYVDETWNQDALDAFQLRPGQVVVMIHTGSRGLGHEVCQDWVGKLQGVPAKHGIELVDRQLACAPINSPEAQGYLGAMAAAANFAFVNRSIIATLVRQTLSKLYGIGEEDVETVYDVCHNIAKWETHTIPVGPRQGEEARLLVHRKGATRAFGPGHPGVPEVYRGVGQPVIVPGDMGRASFVLAASNGALRETFGSCCHGAGRRLSRKAAKQRFEGEELVRKLWEEKGIVVRAAAAQVAAEEAPLAYKDVSKVVESVELADLARKVALLRPMGVVKG